MWLLLRDFSVQWVAVYMATFETSRTLLLQEMFKILGIMIQGEWSVLGHIM